MQVENSMPQSCTFTKRRGCSCSQLIGRSMDANMERTKRRVHIWTQLMPGPTWWPDPWCHFFNESIPTSSVLIFDGSTAFALSEESGTSWVSSALSIGSPRAIQHWWFCLRQQKNWKSTVWTPLIYYGTSSSLAWTVTYRSLAGDQDSSLNECQPLGKIDFYWGDSATSKVLPAGESPVWYQPKDQDIQPRCSFHMDRGINPFLLFSSWGGMREILHCMASLI